MVARIGGRFDALSQATVLERLQQGPGEAARQAVATTATTPLPSRWSLVTIRAEVEALARYSLSGVWRVLHRAGLALHTARVQQFSPDPAYALKQEQLLAALAQTARHPETIATVFLDEMGFYRWPAVGEDWDAQPPLADRQQSKQQQWRLIGALDAWSGAVTYLHGYVVGRAKVGQMYHLLVERYPHIQTLYVVQDNWNIHTHPDVQAVLTTLPTLHPLFLPTYAPWLNPIEKLWRWLRQHLLTLHRLAAAWDTLQQRVFAFLDQFAHGSTDLLRYVGLLGSGRLAQALSRS